MLPSQLPDRQSYKRFESASAMIALSCFQIQWTAMQANLLIFVLPKKLGCFPIGSSEEILKPCAVEA